MSGKSISNIIDEEFNSGIINIQGMNKDFYINVYPYDKELIIKLIGPKRIIKNGFHDLAMEGTSEINIMTSGKSVIVLFRIIDDQRMNEEKTMNIILTALVKYVEALWDQYEPKEMSSINQLEATVKEVFDSLEPLDDLIEKGLFDVK